MVTAARGCHRAAVSGRMAGAAGSHGPRRGRARGALAVAALAAHRGGGDTGRATLSVAEALGGDAAASRGRWPRGLRVSRGSRPARRLPHGVVVLHGQPRGRGRPALRLPAHVLPHRAGAGDASRRASAWATRQVYLAHFALTDTAGRRFHAVERLSRAALGLAGAQAAPFRVWVEDWSAEGAAPERAPDAARARREGDVAHRPRARGGQAARAPGRARPQPKGAEPGNASLLLLAHPHAGARAPCAVGGATRSRSRARRGWTASGAPARSARPQVGWDWFALQLDDGRELMFYRLRRRDGTADPCSGGSLVDADGRRAAARPRRRRARAPAALDEPAQRRALSVALAAHRAVADLALDIAPRARRPGAGRRRPLLGGRGHRARRRGRARPVSGRGYVELVGYGEGRPAGGGRAAAAKAAGRRGRRGAALAADPPAV